MTATSTTHYGKFIARTSVLLDNYPQFTAQEFTFPFEVTPNCLTSTIVSHAIPNMTTPLNTVVKQTWLTSTHAEQGNYNNYCGDIEYLISGNSDFITIDPATKIITVTSSNGSRVAN